MCHVGRLVAASFLTGAGLLGLSLSHAVTQPDVADRPVVLEGSKQPLFAGDQKPPLPPEDTDESAQEWLRSEPGGLGDTLFPSSAAGEVLSLAAARPASASERGGRATSREKNSGGGAPVVRMAAAGQILAASCSDLDNDGYGSPADPSCSFAALDCNDADAGIYPGMPETCGNGIDEDCSGADAACVPAATYHVALAGNDSNAGSASRPWRTIQKAADTMQAGDTVIIRGGTYREQVEPKNSGNSSNGYITYRGAPGETVVIDAQASRSYGFYTGTNSRYGKKDYLALENLTIRNAKKRGIFVQGSETQPANHFTLRDITVESTAMTLGGWSAGIQFKYVNHFLLDGIVSNDNYAHGMNMVRSRYGFITDSAFTYNNGPLTGTDIGYMDTADGITIQNSDHLILNNILAVGNGEDGIDIGGWENRQEGWARGYDSYEVHVRGCTIFDNGGKGLAVSGSSINDFRSHDISFARCVAYNNGETATRIYQSAYNISYIHNTFVDNPSGILFIQQTHHGYVQNNIVAHNPTPIRVRTDQGVHDIFIDYNNWWPNLPSSGLRGQQYVLADPAFVDRLNDDYRLANNSRAIDAAGTLARTTSAGNGSSVGVTASRFFTGGFGMAPGDMIRVGNSPAQVLSIPNPGTLKLDRNLSWRANDAVNFDYAGAGPDLGAFEFSEDSKTPSIPQNVQETGKTFTSVSLSWQLSSDTKAAGIEPKLASNGVPGFDPTTARFGPANEACATNGVVLTSGGNWESQIESASAGSTFLLRAGTYRASTLQPASGVSSAPIVVKPYNCEAVTIEAGEVVPGSFNVFAGLTFVSTGSYTMKFGGSTTRGFTLRNSNLHAGGNGIIRFGDVTDLLIEGNRIATSPSSSTHGLGVVQGSSFANNAVVRRNHFTSDGGSGGKDAIQFASWAGDWLFEENLFKGDWRENYIDIKESTTLNDSFTMRGNHFDGDAGGTSMGTCVIYHGGTDDDEFHADWFYTINFVGNTITNCYLTAYSKSTHDPAQLRNGVLNFRNNIAIARSSSDKVLAIGRHNANIFNNTFINGRIVVGSSTLGNPDNVAVRNNIFFRSNISGGGNVDSCTTNDFFQTSGAPSCSGSITADPRFVNNSSDFRLCEGSGAPASSCSSLSGAIDAGSALGLPFNGAAPDMGAIESFGPTLPPPEANLSITKIDSADPVAAGANLTYTLTVSNAGPGDATNVVATDTLPLEVAFVSTAGCAESPTGGVPTCSLGTIASGASAQYTITVTVDPAAAGAIINQASVTADVTDPAPANNSTLETTLVNALPTVNITAPADGSSFNQGSSATFSGGANDAEDGNLTGSLSWSSSLDGALGTGGSVTTSTLSVGTHSITASVTDANGALASAAITVTINGNNAPPTVTITSPANGSSFNQSAGVTFTGTANDAEDGDLRGSLAWTSSLDGALGTGGSVTTSTLTVGVHTISASVTDLGGAPGSASITVTINGVNAPPTVVITAPAGGSSFAEGSNVTFVGTANDAADGDLTSSLSWTSSLDGHIGSGAGFGASTLTVGAHTVTASVTDSGGLTGFAAITVIINPSLPPLPMVDNLAAADFATSRGTFSGSYQDTHAQDDSYEVLTEVQQGGNPAKARSMLSHTWTFNVAAGTSYQFKVDAHRSPNTEGDNFVFSYSRDNSSFTPMLTIEKVADDDAERTYEFPGDIAGIVYIRVEDSDASQGNASLDTLFVDSMAITTATGDSDMFAPSPPTALASSAGDGSVDLDWADNSEPDLAGYRVHRATASGGPYVPMTASLVLPSAYPDASVSNGNAYYYVVTAVDQAGNQSDPSMPVMAMPHAAGSATSLHVASIVTSLVGKGAKNGRAEVGIVDNFGDPVPGATVTGTFSGVFNESVFGVTNSNGVASLTTNAQVNGSRPFTFCVNNVAHASLAYAPGKNTLTCQSQ